MAEKVKIESGGTKIGSKIVDIHQKNEYTRVNDYKEGMCFGCFGHGIPVGAGVSDICGDCAGKKAEKQFWFQLKRSFMACVTSVETLNMVWNK